VSYGHTYGSEPQNAVSIIDQRVREMVRQQGLPYSNGSIPQQAVAIPRVTALPKVAQEGDEVFLLIDGGADLYLYLRSIPGWVRVSDTVPSVAPATSLPSDPAEGDTFVYDTGTSGVRWQFVYDTSDGTTYPWLCIGGAPLFAQVSTDEPTTGTHTTYQSLATALTIANPLAGDYDVVFGCSGGCTTAANGLFMTPKYGAAATADADGAAAQHQATNDLVTVARSVRKTSLAASTTITMQHRATVNTATNFQRRFVSIKPIRVG
jgi:hypothetical protein